MNSPLVEVIPGSWTVDRSSSVSSEVDPVSAIFESCGPIHGEARYSYECVDPWMIFTVRGNESRVIEGNTERICSGDPVGRLRALTSAFRRDRLPGIPPLPEVAGLIGYGSTPLFLPVDRVKSDPFDLPDMALGLFDSMLIRDRVNGTTTLVSTGLPETGAAAMDRAMLRLEELRGRLGSCPEKDTSVIHERTLPEWLPPMPDEYRESIAKTLHYIGEGDIYQANITRLFRARAERGPFDYYRDLTARNPAPYSGYLQFPEFALLSSSPELFLKTNGDDVESSPIKGTARRGISRKEDQRLANKLQRSAKDNAEHVMIVDLVRNDLGKYCRYGSVHVDPMLAVRTFPSVHHLVSTVRGRRRPGTRFFDLLGGMFPGGSITGAPKRRAVQIIDELEPEGRGPFYGAMGFSSFGGEAVWNLLIRSAVIARGEVGFRVGGGIVADSTAEGEWSELALKGALLWECFRGESALRFEEAML